MSKTYLRNTIFLLIGTFLLTQMAAVTMFLPLIGVISDLTADSTSASSSGSSANGIMTSLAALVVSLLTVALTIKGLARDRSRRWAWVILLVLGLLLLIQAGGMTFVAPKFAELFSDLGH